MTTNGHHLSLYHVYTHLHGGEVVCAICRETFEPGQYRLMSDDPYHKTPVCEVCGWGHAPKLMCLKMLAKAARDFYAGEDSVPEHIHQKLVERNNDPERIKRRLQEIVTIDSNLVDLDDRSYHGIRILYDALLLGGELRNEANGTTDLCAWLTGEEINRLPLVGLAKVGVRLALGSTASR